MTARYEHPSCFPLVIPTHSVPLCVLSSAMGCFAHRVVRGREAAKRAILLAAATACVLRTKDFSASSAMRRSLVVGNVGLLADGQVLEPGTRC